jgi:hypothetical protein
VIVENGQDVGRLYEDGHAKAELRWFWSITVYVNPMLGIITSGRAASRDIMSEYRATSSRNARAIHPRKRRRGSIPLPLRRGGDPHIIKPLPISGR